MTAISRERADLEREATIVGAVCNAGLRHQSAVMMQPAPDRLGDDLASGGLRRGRLGVQAWMPWWTRPSTRCSVESTEQVRFALLFFERCMSQLVQMDWCDVSGRFVRCSDLNKQIDGAPFPMLRRLRNTTG